MYTKHENLKTEHQHCMEMKRTHEQRLKGRFIVNYWDESDADLISVTGYEKSTVCSLSDHHDLLRTPSMNFRDVEYYDTKLRRWILNNWDHPLEVTTDTQVFIRQCGVVCKDLGELLRNYQDGPAGPPHMHKKMTNKRCALRQEVKMQQNSTHSKHYYSSDAKAIGSPSIPFASSTPHTPTPCHFSIVQASSLPSIKDDSESESESMITSIYECPSPLPMHPNLKRNHDTVDDSIQTPPHKVLKLDANFTSNQSTLTTPNLRTPTGIMTCTPGQSKNTPSSGRWPAFIDGKHHGGVGTVPLTKAYLKKLKQLHILRTVTGANWQPVCPSNNIHGNFVLPPLLFISNYHKPTFLSLCYSPSMSLPNLSQASESLQSILAAHQAQPKPDFLYTCNNCHEEVLWKRCKSNDNGNEGCWMAVCRKFSGKQACTFFRWSSGLKSASGSPTLGASPVLQPVHLSNTTLLLICTALACKRKAHSLCDNKMCRRHCRLLGGCRAKGHDPAPILWNSHSPSPHIDLKGKGRAFCSPSILPRKASVPATIQENHPRDHDLEVAERAKNNVIVYAWSEARLHMHNTITMSLTLIQDGTEPTIYEFQQGFKFPNFFFSHNVLQKLNMLYDATPAPLCVQRYNHLLEMWTMFDLGHMVILQPHNGGILLVKQACVKDCIGFHDHLHKLTQIPLLATTNLSRPPSSVLLLPRATTNLSRPSSVLSLTESDDDNRPACPIKCCHSSILSLTDDSDDDGDNSWCSSSLPSALGPIIAKESSGSVLSHGRSKSSAIEVEKVSVWPADFYVVGIADGFNACKRAAESQCSIAAAFVRHFGVPFRASTYYDNRRLWELGTN
ncbi:hypothetical protein DEU56DRAFT_753533 [Suillus clintonianus]|uniref:uncharacterized protein n=1 Tax=Suillus clintonianus TaxID=1904413 RepID=UPI001B879EA0|nr:uncharacterized protein DEU56DRAFT_753533 [Suillus clintonianus]KAG2146624.1 hypothetical protein DEU56DRAFT_753533 [Suillus clintonianus]